MMGRSQWRLLVPCCVVWCANYSFGFQVAQTTRSRQTTTRLFGEYEEYMAKRRAQEAKQQDGQPPFPDLTSNSSNDPIAPRDPARFDATETNPTIEDAVIPPAVVAPPKKKNFSPGGGSASWKTSSPAPPEPMVSRVEEEPTTMPGPSSDMLPVEEPTPESKPRKEWLRPNRSQQDDEETARLKQIMMEARQKVQQSRQQQRDETNKNDENAWWKQTNQLDTTSGDGTAALDPPTNAGEAPVIENEQLETPATVPEPQESWWKTSDASQQAASSLGPPTNAGEPPVIENERLDTPSTVPQPQSPWWKTSDALEQEAELDTNAGEAPVIENERLDTPSTVPEPQSSSWKASDAAEQAASSLDPPTNAGEAPVIENERLDTPSTVPEPQSSWWKASDASQQGTSSLDPPTNAGEPPVIENERLDTSSTVPQPQSPWWKTSDAAEQTASSLDPPTNAGEPPVIEEERLDTPSTVPEPQSSWWKASDASQQAASSLDPPTNAGEPPVIENERLDTTTEAKSEGSSWWKPSNTPEGTVDPPLSTGETPMIDGERFDTPNDSFKVNDSGSWKASETAKAEPSLDPTQLAGEAPVVDNETLEGVNKGIQQDESASRWWKVPDLSKKSDDAEKTDDTPESPVPKDAFPKESVVTNEQPKQEQEKKTPWWKGAQKQEAKPIQAIKPPLTMRYSSSAATVSEHILKSCPSEMQASGAGGSSTWDAFQRVEENWRRLRFGFDEPPRNFVTNDAAVGSCSPACWERLRQFNSRAKPLDYDILVCGGTLGIFFATALAMKGHRVGVVEAGKLQGRAQEWNISQNELDELVEMGILTKEDVEAAIKTDFPACRSGFKNEEDSPLGGGYFSNGVGYECLTPDVLNLGVAPSILLDRVKQRFEKLGGVVYESTRLQGIALSSAVGVALDVGEEKDPITTQLVLDCMGNASPISKQQRQGKKPDGVCAVVGSCAGGFDAKSNKIGDIIYTFNPIQNKGANGSLQYFWEAFPVGIGRNGVAPGKSDVKTTYMFTYMDADEQRPSMLSLMEDYWNLLPTYQPSIQNPATDLDVKRVLFAYFPTYTDSPLKPQWDRILAVGDASGIQSPLSFGGFGALTRHLDRITTAVDEAMENQLLDKESLGAINAYTPNLSAAWMFQKAMSVRMGQKVDDKFVNRLLAVNFEVMDGMGQRTIKPFLQDVIRFDGLVGSLARSFVADPTYMPTIVAHVGIPRLVDWLGHVTMMGTYDLLHKAATPILRPVVNNAVKDPAQKYRWRRRMESWKFGSGNDYVLPEEDDRGENNNQDFYDDEEEETTQEPKTYAPFS